MDLSEGIQRLLPPGPYEVNAIEVEYYRVFRTVRLPEGSPVPSEVGIALGCPANTKDAYFVAIDAQTYVPEFQALITNIRLEENNLAFTRLAHWRDQLWHYNAILDLSPNDHLIEHGWKLTTFHRLLSAPDFECLSGLDRGCHWVHLAR